MGKLSDADRKTLERLQALADAPDDEGEDDYEVWVKNEQGRETKLPSRKANGWLRENFGISLHEDPADGDGDGDGDGSDGDGDGDGSDRSDPGPKGGGYFSRRKA